MQDETHGELISGVAIIAMAVTMSPKTAAAQEQAKSAKAATYACTSYFL